MPWKGDGTDGAKVRDLTPPGRMILADLMLNLGYRDRAAAVNFLTRHQMGKRLTIKSDPRPRPGYTRRYLLVWWTVTLEEAQVLWELRWTERLSKKAARNLRDSTWGRSPARHVRHWSAPPPASSTSRSTTSTSFRTPQSARTLRRISGKRSTRATSSPAPPPGSSSSPSASG